ncbi:amine oxidase [Chloropicon primus]|uniref:Amine oxidase n=1 Tax=Chloropicon primus TaxID=1764295 RepID=A0A5B8MQU1_9CHLO|nr:amine oxidase [Chloropicon primus]UPR01205.1 amine oxidase [Chloropicon primus]|eukprot:QDZ21985.1 amine oxidase [Chloropicon primus]
MVKMRMRMRVSQSRGFGLRGGGFRGPRLRLGCEVVASEEPGRRIRRDASVAPPVPSEADVVVIGSGIGGLCCAAVAAKYGFSVAVLESHTIPGGCAHSFKREGYEFDSGPSFFAGIGAGGKSNNALKQVLDLVGEEVECAEYRGWNAHLPEGLFACENNEESYLRELRKYGGDDAVREWKALSAAMGPLARSAEALSFASLRNDAFAALTVGRSGKAFAKSGILNEGPLDAMNQLNGPFSYLLEKANVRNEFLRNVIDLECFVLSGMVADGTLSPEMAYMYHERHKPDSKLDYPLGGCRAIIDALIRGIEKLGGTVHCGKHVEQIAFSGGRATGVLLKSGQRVSAKKKVVSNASVWDTYSKLVPKSELPGEASKLAHSVPKLNSFMHLHLGIDGEGLPDDLGIHHLVVNSWEGGVDADQNVVNISIPSTLDPSLAPRGKHLVHAYTAANEPYEVWEGVERGTEEYNAMKEERSQCVWAALERVIPDVRERTELKLVGTPLTHARFVRRQSGSYGPGIAAGKQSWPTANTAIDGLLLCGDSTFPGIGVPAVAGSGFIAANSIASPFQHLKLLETLDNL